jgi:hypothetical protein
MALKKVDEGTRIVSIDKVSWGLNYHEMKDITRKFV